MWVVYHQTSNGEIGSGYSQLFPGFPMIIGSQSCFDRPAGLTLLQLLCKLRGSQFLQSDRITCGRALLHMNMRDSRNSPIANEWIHDSHHAQFVYEIGIGYTPRNRMIVVITSARSHQKPSETMVKRKEGMIDLGPLHFNGGWD